MTALVLEPHQDDCALFSAFNAIRHQAHIVCVTASTERREAESRAAASILGCTFEQWPEPWEAPDWDAVLAMLLRYDKENAPEVVYAPAHVDRGNDQHNRVAFLAVQAFPGRVVGYETYVHGGPRTTGTPVEYERAWVLLKLRALACFESQILGGPVRFFTHSLDEWTRA